MVLRVVDEKGKTRSVRATLASRPEIEEAKEVVIGCVAQGMTTKLAMARVGREVKTLESWRRNDRDFAKRLDDVRLARKNGDTTEFIAARPDNFVDFRREFLGFETYPHMLQWLDVIEGRVPREIPGTEFTQRNMNRFVVNCPPYHAKSQFFTDYITWLIVNNPNIRILIVSKKQEFAQKFVYHVTQRLTSSRFSRLQATYAPKGGFRPAPGEGKFSQNTLYVAGRTADYRDPTLEAVGLGGQIYGARADLIILDDTIVLKNAGEFEKQAQWLESEVTSRVKEGKVILVGTRLASMDLYSFLQQDDRYPSGQSPWSYLRQPMVLEYDDEPENWKTLWPRSNAAPDEAAEQQPDGTYRMYDGIAAREIRAGSTARTWSLVYQQQNVPDDATFNPQCIAGSTDGRRMPGPLIAGAAGHPKRGAEGMFTIATMDPAMVNDTFTMVMKIDRATGHIWVENAWVKTNPPASYFRDHIKDVTIAYGVNEWVIEKNAFQSFLSDDPELTNFMMMHGVTIFPHQTGDNKNDPDFGVASVAPWFGSIERVSEGGGRSDANRTKFRAESNRLHLPRTSDSPGLSALVDQLVTWVPGVRGNKLKQDGPMALWFGVYRARTHLGPRASDGSPLGTIQQHMNLPFATRGMRAQQSGAAFAGIGQRYSYGSRR